MILSKEKNGWRKEELVKDIVARIGEVLGVDLYELGASGMSFLECG
jgi:hypothetical protein